MNRTAAAGAANPEHSGPGHTSSIGNAESTDGVTAAASPWAAPTVRRPLAATVHVPTSKSLTNRLLILAVLAAGPCRLRAPLHSRDSDLMVRALASLGAAFEEVPGKGRFGPDWRISPIVPDRTDGRQIHIDCGLAGTVMRFVPPLAALVNGCFAFDGDPYARRRPMGPILTALRDLGVRVDDDGRGSLPFVVHGTGRVRGGHVVIDAAASSQFVSALLLAGSSFERGIHLEHVGKPVPSLPHIEMTIELLRSVGVAVDSSTPNQWRVAPAPIQPFDLRVEQDLSNAAPFLAAALAVGGSVRVPDWPEQTTQGGDHVRRILAAFGADVVHAGGALTVTGPAVLAGVDLDLSQASELSPTVAALATLAATPSRLRGIGHIRGHETDRLAALSTEINGLGGDVTETQDGLVINPAPLHGGLFRSYADHRLATAGAVLGLAVDGVAVDDIACTSKTMPEFTVLWQQLTAGEGRS